MFCFGIFYVSRHANGYAWRLNERKVKESAFDGVVVRVVADGREDAAATDR